MAAGKVELQGLDAALDLMRDLTPRLRRRGARVALRNAANLVRDAARENAKRIDDPATAEKIYRNIVVRGMKRRDLNSAGGGKGDIGFRVGILGGAQQYAYTRVNVRAGRVGQTYATTGSKTNPGGDTWYWRQIEFGNANQPARPFMRPALSGSAQPATDVFTEGLSEELSKALKGTK